MTTSTYDPMGRLLSQDAPLSGVVTTWEYDDAGLLLSTTDAEGETVNYFYNDQGQLLETQAGSGQNVISTLSVFDELNTIEGSSRDWEG